MNKIHHGKIPTWYDKDSHVYDIINENTDNAKVTNKTVEKLLKKYKVNTVFDMTCGTGSQVFYLHKRGYKVTGSDISKGMLNIAKKKAKQEKINVDFYRGNIRNIHLGKFDAVISIFNAIGHLSRLDFEIAIRNIRKNLNQKGIYIFDIFNLNYYLQKDNITKFTIDWLKSKNNLQYREVQHSVIDQNGVLISYTTNYIQKNLKILKTSKTIITLQLYTLNKLKKILEKNGFKIISQCGIDGKNFFDNKTERMVIVARKTS